MPQFVPSVRSRFAVDPESDRTLLTLMCNLYSLTKGQAAIRDWFRARHDYQAICRCSRVSSTINSRRSSAEQQMANASLSWRAGDAWSAAVRRPTGDEYPQCEQPALARMARQAKPLRSPRDVICEYADTKPRKTPTWFTLSEDRPLFAFLWTPWRGAQGPKSAPIEALIAQSRLSDAQRMVTDVVQGHLAVPK
jgi:hypothetical protein